MYYWFLKKSNLHETILMVSKRPTDKLCFSNSNLNSIFNSDTVFALSEIHGLESATLRVVCLLSPFWDYIWLPILMIFQHILYNILKKLDLFCFLW